MAQTPIAVVVGSLRRDSFNRKLAAAIARRNPLSSWQFLQGLDRPVCFFGEKARFVT